MLELTRRVEEGNPVATVTLPLEKRIRSRLRVTLDDGTPAGVFLTRGETLNDGDLLADVAGKGLAGCLEMWALMDPPEVSAWMAPITSWTLMLPPDVWASTVPRAWSMVMPAPPGPPSSPAASARAGTCTKLK